MASRLTAMDIVTASQSAGPSSSLNNPCFTPSEANFRESHNTAAQRFHDSGWARTTEWDWTGRDGRFGVLEEEESAESHLSRIEVVLGLEIGLVAVEMEDVVVVVEVLGSSTVGAGTNR